jgi:hypothetical protein
VHRNGSESSWSSRSAARRQSGRLPWPVRFQCHCRKSSDDSRSHAFVAESSHRTNSGRELDERPRPAQQALKRSSNGCRAEPAADFDIEGGDANNRSTEPEMAASPRLLRSSRGPRETTMKTHRIEYPLRRPNRRCLCGFRRCRSSKRMLSGCILYVEPPKTPREYSKARAESAQGRDALRPGGASEHSFTG